MLTQKEAIDFIDQAPPDILLAKREGRYDAGGIFVIFSEQAQQWVNNHMGLQAVLFAVRQCRYFEDLIVRMLCDGLTVRMGCRDGYYDVLLNEHKSIYVVKARRDRALASPVASITIPTNEHA